MDHRKQITLKMKILLSLGLVILIYAIPNSDYLNQVDYSGLYYTEVKNPKIINEQLELEGNEEFKHTFLYSDGVSSIIYLTKGTYKLRGNKLQLIPTTFINKSRLVQHNKNVSQVKLRRLRGSDTSPGITTIDKSSPKLFKERLATFESGAFRLKARYYIKQMKDKLSLCLLDLKTAQYCPQFIQYKK
jgi:hypothetical protein